MLVAPATRRSAGPGRHRAGRRPAHQRVAHGALPDPVRPGDAHRDVAAPGHPGATSTTLRARGAVVIDPDSGRLTGADSGPGRLPDPAELAAVATAVLADPGIAVRAAQRDLAGLLVAVSAGGTREHLDPVRFVGNRSSGRMGWALARAAVLRGAEVHLVAANVALPAPPGAEVETVVSTGDLAAAMTTAAKTADLVVMAAAAADFTPAAGEPDQDQEVGPGQPVSRLDLVQTTDVLAAPGRRPHRRPPDPGRLRRRDADRGDLAARPGSGQAAPQGLRSAGAQRRRRRARRSAATTTRSCC